MAFEELKQRQSVMWGNGPYQRITDTLVDIHELVLERLDPEAGLRRGEPVRLAPNPQRLHFFDRETEAAIQ